ncbi:MAG UNVERIFIED_CONTAM: hypothetical protein LVT10_20310 [Anaerolineae bacterium]
MMVSTDPASPVRTLTKPPTLVLAPQLLLQTKVIGKSEPKVDAVKLAMGKGVYADDLEMRGMLHGASLTSPHAHARPRHVDTHKAKALPGVHAVLSLPRCPPCIIRLRRTELPQPPAV